VRLCRGDGESVQIPSYFPSAQAPHFLCCLTEVNSEINSKNGQFEGANRIQREQGTLKWEQEKLMVFKHEIEIMTGSSEARLGTVFFLCETHSRSLHSPLKKHLFFD
jgi:hypothetical protein